MFKKPRRQINRIFIHCSASDNKKHDDVSVMDQWHKARGWSGVGYHYFIKKDGTLQNGRPLWKIPAAQARHNRGTIAICLHGLKKSKFTQAQFKTLKKLCKEIHKEIPKATFHGHKEVAAKACPVFDYKFLLKLDYNGNLGI